MTNKQAIKIIHNYGAVLETASNIYGIFGAPVSILKNTKDEIKLAIWLTLISCQNEDLITALIESYSSLALFIDDKISHQNSDCQKFIEENVSIKLDGNKLEKLNKCLISSQKILDDKEQLRNDIIKHVPESFRHIYV